MKNRTNRTMRPIRMMHRIRTTRPRDGTSGTVTTRSPVTGLAPREAPATLTARTAATALALLLLGALGGCGGAAPEAGGVGDHAGHTEAAVDRDSGARDADVGAGTHDAPGRDAGGRRPEARGATHGATDQETGGAPGGAPAAARAANRTVVRLGPDQAERIGLRWALVERKPLLRTIRLSSTVEYPESEMEWVSPKVSGWVERLHVTFEGAPVRAGQPLLELYSPELVTAQEELLLAGRLDSALAGAQAAPGRTFEEVARRRLLYWDIPEEQIRRLLETGRVTRTMTLQAPATGIVTRKRVFEGQGIRAGENLFMIAPTDPVWIEAAVFEQDLPFVREGLPAEVGLEAIPGRSLRGRVSYLYPQLREQTRTVTARVVVPNPDGTLRPGMYATVRIENRTEPVLSVPASALLETGTRSLVFLDLGRNRLTPREVRAGRAGDERVEILAGLEPGDRVATSAQFLLDSEANLMEAMQAMMVQVGRSTGGVEDGDMRDGGMQGDMQDGGTSGEGGGGRSGGGRH